MEPLSPYSLIATTTDFPNQLFASQTPDDYLNFCENDINNEEKMRELKSKGNLHTYLRAQIELKCKRNDDGKFIVAAFTAAVRYIKEGAFSLSQAKELINTLQISIPVLHLEDIASMLDKILANFRPDESSNAASGHEKVLELLPYLVVRSSSFTRMALIERICNMKWDGSSGLMLAATLVDLCESKEECELAKNAISKLVIWHSERDCWVALEDIPGLLYNLTLLGSKAACNSTEWRLKVLSVVADSIDSISSYSVSTEHVEGRIRPVISRSNLENVIGTIMCHLSLLLGKDRELSAAMMSWIKAGFIFSEAKPSGDISCTRLILCLLAACSSHSDGKLVHGVRDVINGVVEKEAMAQRSVWFQRNTWNSLKRTGMAAVKASFAQIIAGPFLQPSLVQALVDLAFQLAAVHSQSAKATWASLKTVKCTPTPLLNKTPTEADLLGEWMLLKLFQQCDYTRGVIMKEIVQRLIATNARKVESNFPNTGGRVSDTLGLMKLLYDLVGSCGPQMHLVESDLCDIVANLSNFEHETAGDLVRLLTPLFQYSAALADRCVLCIRKATFANDVSSRMAAVCALTSLLHFQIKHLESPQMSTAAGLSIDEVLILLKRSLQHQSAVRSLLYEKILLLHNEFASVRIVLLRFLVNHLWTYLKDLDDCIESKTMLDLGRCLDNQGISEPIDDLLLTLLMMTNVVQDEQDEALQFGCSQAQYSLSTCQDTVQTRELLTNVLMTSAKSSLQDFGIDGVTTWDSYSRAELFVNVLEAAAIIAVAQSSRTNDMHKIELLKILCRRRTCVLQDIDTFKRTKEVERKKAKRAASQQDPIEDLPPDHVGRRALASAQGPSRLSRSFLVLDVMRMVHDMDEEHDKVVFDDAPTRETLLRLALGATEVCLSFQHEAMTTYSHNFEWHHRRNAECASKWSTIYTDLVPMLITWTLEFQTNILIETRDFMKTSLLTTLDHSTRCLLGCIRVSIVSARIVNTDGNDIYAPVKELLANSFNRLLGSRLDIQESVKKFEDLLFREHTSEALKDSVDNWSVTLTAIIAELVSIMDVPMRKLFSQRFSAKLVGKTGVSSLLCKAFVDVLIAVCPCTPTERLEKMMEVGQLIASCDSEERGGGGGEGEDSSPWIYLENARAAAEAILALCDKVCEEVSYLMKAKAMAVVKKSATGNDGDSSDDDDRTAASDVEVVVICATLNRVLNVISLLITAGEAIETVAEKVVTLLCKFYKIITELTKGLVVAKATWLPETFKTLMDTVSVAITPKINQYLLALHQGAGDKATKKLSRQAKCVPRLMFEMEKLELQLIKLSALVTEKAVVSKYLQKSRPRDFRIVDGPGNEAGDDDRGPKRKRKNGKENRRGGESDDEE